MHQSAGEVRNRYVLLSRLRKPNTYSLSKCSARNSLGATTPDWFKKQQVSMKTTNQRFAWPRGWTLNFTGAQKWHIGIKYHFIREQVENGNVELSSAVQKKWLRICLLKAWVVNSSGNYERCLDWMRCRLVPPASERECWGSVEYFVMTIYLFQGPN